MSLDRQPVLISSSTFEYAAGHEVPEHQHERHQLSYAGRGALMVRSRSGTWVVPPLRALWIPARTQHSITVRGSAQMQALYFDASVQLVPKEIGVVIVSKLLRALIEHLSESENVGPSEKARLNAVLLDQLVFATTKPLQLPIFQDDRLRRIANALLADPSDSRTLADWGRTVGASERTLSRAFQVETQSTFGRWRTDVRMVRAVEFLAERFDVNTVAAACGYETSSAFVQAFKFAYGTTPATFFPRTSL
jgi:AraC-like DNA-binding protein